MMLMTLVVILNGKSSIIILRRFLYIAHLVKDTPEARHCLRLDSSFADFIDSLSLSLSLVQACVSSIGKPMQEIQRRREATKKFHT